ncbi:large conductance mechanosensitive channel protein MscL [Plastoroseomonas arctica]|uniref:Large-conductance mechanosensitive channel n=1 Tax=Plastoroseomonas arctica TaxID=1509237 RepID=A0AAF1KUI9_9PROT|nr:large conductance mechanosensitive channel protein MscL [Plastoroseomonas arctica]MBR0656232.1 large conductance mechanosensitive channel protein MscL [Plastoroseomonas arctica]
MRPPITVTEPAWLREFKAFIMRGSVVDLAVGIIIGAAFTAIVASMVEDLVNPIIGLLIGGIDFSNLFVVISGERRPSLDATRQGGASVLAIGKFLNAVIKFAIVAFAVFWMVKALSRFKAKEEAKPAEPPAPTPSELLLTEIRDELRAARAATPTT